MGLQTWQLVEPQITSNLAKVYCNTRKCANILCDVHFPYPSSPFKITKLYVCEYSQKKSKGVKRGVFEAFHLSKKQHPPYACAFQGRDKTQGGQPPPRGSEMTSHCVLNVPGEKEGWLIEKLFIYGEIKCKRGGGKQHISFF